MSGREHQVAERLAQDTLDQLEITTAPVDVEMIATRLGIRVIREPLEAGMSGVLVVRDSQAAIGVNRNHHPRRQRFTIAHEIAHYLLHIEESDLFVDDMLTFYRDDQLSAGEFRKEREANALAAALLMPQGLIEGQIRQRQIDLYDDSAIAQLARHFDVSEQALTIRLMHLDLLAV